MNEWQTPEEQDEQEARKRAAQDAHLDALNRHWRAQHRKRVRAIEKQLLSAHTDATAVDRVLVGLAAHDAGLAELLGAAQVLVASRVVAFVDNPKLVLMLARALGETISCRNAATTRVEQLLQTVGTLRAQRALTTSTPKSPHLRRVA